MIPSRNATDAHKSLLSILKPFPQCTCSLHSTRKAWCVHSSCGDSWTVSRSYKQQSRSPFHSQECPAPHQARLRPCGNHLLNCGLFWRNEKRSNETTTSTSLFAATVLFSSPFAYTLAEGNIIAIIKKHTLLGLWAGWQTTDFCRGIQQEA